VTGMLDSKTVRGIVLALIKHYADVNELEFEETIALLQSAPDDSVRAEAESITRIWEGAKPLDPTTHSKLMRYRLRLIDDGVQRLEVLTRLKEQNA
jgi:hypothetical protein